MSSLEQEWVDRVLLPSGSLENVRTWFGHKTNLIFSSLRLCWAIGCDDSREEGYSTE